jgi:hypothetical protein
MKALTLSALLLLLITVTAHAQLAMKQDVLGAGISIGMTPHDVDSLAEEGEWSTLYSAASARKFTSETNGMTGVYEVRFQKGVVSRVTIRYTLTKEAAKSFGGMVKVMKQVMVNRAERTEGRGKNMVYISTASDGSTIRTRWTENGARAFGLQATVSAPK